MIQLDRVSVRQGAFSIEDISLAIPSGTYTVLMGKTGTGKTTLLEAIVGLRPVSAGRVLVDHRDVTRAKPSLRGIGYVPQDGALFSTMTVRDQLGFGLRIRRAARAMVDERVRELAELLGVERLLDRSPRGLSGGEIQRVALGRALSFRPRTLLLDEPLSALDESTREELAGLLRRVQTAAGATVLHVTHNREDARLLADLILRLEEGCIRTECGPGAEQLGVPDRLKPAR